MQTFENYIIKKNLLILIYLFIYDFFYIFIYFKYFINM